VRHVPALALAGLVAGLAACAGPTPSPTPPAPPPEAPATPSASPRSALQVFDEKGQPSPCPSPKAECPEASPPTSFLDRCRLAGFRVLQCGCEQRCTGDVSGAVRRYYDAAGQQKECAPAHADCTPPEASPKFQDACSERAFRLEVCGCEWLCSGNFRK
jgi:hypothetical protein